MCSPGDCAAHSTQVASCEPPAVERVIGAIHPRTGLAHPIAVSIFDWCRELQGVSIVIFPAQWPVAALQAENCERGRIEHHSEIRVLIL